MLDHLWIILALPLAGRGHQRPARQELAEVGGEFRRRSALFRSLFLPSPKTVREFSQLSADQFPG